MENKGLTVPKWVLINQPKIPQNVPKFFCPKLSVQTQKFGISMKKGFIGRPLSVISLIEKKSSKFTWCALQMRSRSCRFKNLETTSAPKVKETPRSFSPQPWTSLSGSDHRRSHNRPGNKKNSWKYNNEKSLGGIKCISSTTPTMMIMMWYFDIAIFVMCPRTNQMIAACYN